jgi:hypothetical protein
MSWQQGAWVSAIVAGICGALALVIGVPMLRRTTQRSMAAAAE